jgi:hypothetical protein
MVLKDVLIRGGIAFLEPSAVEMKGYQTDDREVNQDREFVRGLRARMRQVACFRHRQAQYSLNAQAAKSGARRGGESTTPSGATP